MERITFHSRSSKKKGIQVVFRLRDGRDMKGKRDVRKETKERIEGMESEAKYTKRIEKMLAGYTEEELEVWEFVYRIKSEQMLYLTCYHPSSDKKVNYRVHTDPEGLVLKVEREKKTKSKIVWEELKLLESKDGE